MLRLVCRSDIIRSIFCKRIASSCLEHSVLSGHVVPRRLSLCTLGGMLRVLCVVSVYDVCLPSCTSCKALHFHQLLQVRWNEVRPAH